MRSLFLLFLLGSAAVWAQSSPGTSNSAPSKQDSGSSPPSSASSPSPSPSDSKPARRPNLDPPRSDRVNADSLEEGESSSKDTQIDLSPPPDDAKAHPRVQSLRMRKDRRRTGMWASSIPGIRTRRRKTSRWAISTSSGRTTAPPKTAIARRCFYKDNDAMATFRLAVCLEKMDRLYEAQKEYERYLQILPYGPQAADAKKAIDRLKGPAASAEPVK